MEYNSGVVVLIISNQPFKPPMCLDDLKSLARLFPELYSTQSFYHYISLLVIIIVVIITTK